jgi:hypothetical protein
VQIETKQVNGTNKETKSRGFIRKVNNFDFLTMLRISEDSSIRKSKGYNFLVDTFSVSSLSTVVFGANELFIAHISGKELLKQRALGLVLCTFTSRPYGIFRDWCFKKMKINENTSERVKFVADIAVTELYWSAIYTAQLAIATSGNIKKTLLGVGGGAVIDLFYARPLGVWMDFVRRVSGIKSDDKSTVN